MLHEAATGGMRDLDRFATGCLREAARKKRKLVEGIRSAALRGGEGELLYTEAGIEKPPGEPGGKLEREKGFEPSTLALARRCSTAELFPQKLSEGAVL